MKNLVYFVALLIVGLVLGVGVPAAEKVTAHAPPKFEKKSPQPDVMSAAPAHVVRHCAMPSAAERQKALQAEFYTIAIPNRAGSKDAVNLYVSARRQKPDFVPRS